MYACSEHLNYAKVITAWREVPAMAHQMVHGEGLGHKGQNRWEAPLKELEKHQKLVSDEFSMHQWLKQNPCTRLSQLTSLDAPRTEEEAQGRPHLGRTHDPCTYGGGKDEEDDR